MFRRLLGMIAPKPSGMPKGKTRSTLMLDDGVLAAFRARATVEGA
jgi:hypothetical protein